jgi:predicted aconitase with swiveling domain
VVVAEEYRGRPVLPGRASGPALVSRVRFDALASFKLSLQEGVGTAVSADPGNPDILGAELTGSVLCVPQAVGSTSAGTTWDLIACRHLEPVALLFAESIDSLSAGGLVVARVWDASPIVVVDRLGEEFLTSLKTGCPLEVSEDGVVIVS